MRGGATSSPLYVVYVRSGVNLRPIADFHLPSAAEAIAAFREIYGREGYPEVVAIPLISGDLALEGARP